MDSRYKPTTTAQIDKCPVLRVRVVMCGNKSDGRVYGQSCETGQEPGGYRARVAISITNVRSSRHLQTLQVHYTRIYYYLRYYSLLRQ